MIAGGLTFAALLLWQAPGAPVQAQAAQAQAQALVASGIAKYRAHDDAGAIADATQALGLDPQNAKAWQCRGLARLESKDYAGAVGDFTAAMRADPSLSGVAHRFRGVAEQALGQSGEAASDFDAAIAQAPDDAANYAARAGLERSQGKAAAAQQDEAHAAALAPAPAAAAQPIGGAPSADATAAGVAAAEALQSGDFMVAVLDYTQVLQAADDAGARLGRAEAHLNRDEFTAAADDARAALKLNPAPGLRARALVLAAQALAGAQDDPGAIAAASDALALAPANEPALAARAAAELAAGDLKAAEADYGQAIAGATLGSAALALDYRWRAVVRRRVGDVTGAESDEVQRYLIDQPHMAQYTALERPVQAREQAQDLNGVIPLFTSAAALVSAPVAAQYYRGEARQRSGDLLGALADYRRAFLFPSGIEQPICYNSAYTHVALGDMMAGVADFSRIIALRPYDAANYRLRGAMERNRLGDNESALRDYRRATELNPDDVEAWSGLAAVEQALGQALGHAADADADNARAQQAVPVADANRESGASLARSRAQENAGDLDGALTTLQALIDRHINRASVASAYMARIQLEKAHNRNEAARDDADALVQLEPEAGAAYSQRAAVAAGSGDNARAITDYGDAIKFGGGFDDYVARADARRAWGDAAGAAADLSTAIAHITDGAEPTPARYADLFRRRAAVRAVLRDAKGAAADQAQAVRLAILPSPAAGRRGGN